MYDNYWTPKVNAKTLLFQRFIQFQIARITEIIRITIAIPFNTIFRSNYYFATYRTVSKYRMQARNAP